MRLLYSKPKLNNLSQGERIAFIRQFRKLTQDDVSDMLHLTGECKRRTVTRYETNIRSPKEERLKEISKILFVDPIYIRNYDFKDNNDLVYLFLWLEELFPRIEIYLNTNNDELNNFFIKWNSIRKKRKNNKISYEDYVEWKLNYEFRKEKQNEN